MRAVAIDLCRAQTTTGDAVTRSLLLDHGTRTVVVRESTGYCRWDGCTVLGGLPSDALDAKTYRDLVEYLASDRSQETLAALCDGASDEPTDEALECLADTVQAMVVTDFDEDD